MHEKENEAITCLLDSKSGKEPRKVALKWLGEYLEESYILNLPLPKNVLQALEAVSRRKQGDPALKEGAKSLLGKYRR